MTTNKQIEEGIISDIGKGALVAATIASGTHYTPSAEAGQQKPQKQVQDSELSRMTRLHPYREDAQQTTERLAQIATKLFKHVNIDDARQYASLAVKHSHPEFPTSEDLMASMAQESRFKPRAVSSAGAYGLMQVVPKHWEIQYRDISTPETQVKQGSYIMKDYYKQYKKNKDVTIQAYNMGPGNIAKKNFNEAYLKKHQYFKKFFAGQPEDVKEYVK